MKDHLFLGLEMGSHIFHRLVGPDIVESYMEGNTCTINRFVLTDISEGTYQIYHSYCDDTRVYKGNNTFNIGIENIKLNSSSKSLVYYMNELKYKHDVKIVIRFTNSGWNRLVYVLNNPLYKQDEGMNVNLLDKV